FTPRAMVSRPARVSSTPLGAPVVPEVAITAATPAATGTPPVSARRVPASSTRWVGRRRPNTSSRAAAGSDGATGRTASPASHAAMTAPAAAAPSPTTATRGASSAAGTPDYRGSVHSHDHLRTETGTAHGQHSYHPPGRRMEARDARRLHRRPL